MTVTTAVVSFAPDASISTFKNIQGGVIFRQESESTPITISVQIRGLDPNKTHGWHIHSSAVPSGPVNCTKTGGHFNPFNATHGAPTNDKTKRHVGDLGNFQTDAQGNVKFDMSDKLVTLFGKNNITGLAVVIHEKNDDLGLGGNPASLQNGNAGARLACGNILVGQVMTGTDIDGYNRNGTATSSSAATTGTQKSSAERLYFSVFPLLSFLLL